MVVRAGEGDVLLLGSGSGATASLVAAATRARAAGACVVLLSATGDSPLAELAQHLVLLQAPTPKAEGGVCASASVQPMGSLFEQSVGVVLDGMVLALMQRLGEDAASMFARHANVE